MRDRLIKARKCPVCGTKFETNRINRTYCSHKCQMMHYYDVKFDKEQKMLNENEQLHELIEKNRLLTIDNDYMVNEIKNLIEGYGKIIFEDEIYLVVQPNARDDYFICCKTCQKRYSLDGNTYLEFDKISHKYTTYCTTCFEERYKDKILETDKKQLTLNLPK